MFITFEGIDGVGKTTQIKLLREYFIGIGYNVIVLREPGGTVVSESIRKILLDNDHNLDPISELLLFEAARANLVKNVIKPALDADNVVISDRFYDSTTAYQGYGRKLNLNSIELLNRLVVDGVKPELTFYLKLPLDLAQERSSKRFRDRIENAGGNFFNDVITGFEELAKAEPNRIKIIDASEDVMTTHKSIVNEIVKKFGVRS